MTPRAPPPPPLSVCPLSPSALSLSPRCGGGGVGHGPDGSSGHCLCRQVRCRAGTLPGATRPALSNHITGAGAQSTSLEPVPAWRQANATSLHRATQCHAKQPQRQKSHPLSQGQWRRAEGELTRGGGQERERMREGEGGWGGREGGLEVVLQRVSAYL